MKKFFSAISLSFDLTVIDHVTEVHIVEGGGVA